jgi:hypothetical protein
MTHCYGTQVCDDDWTILVLLQEQESINNSLSTLADTARMTCLRKLVGCRPAHLTVSNDGLWWSALLLVGNVSECVYV